jgi:hypothetical protein
MKENKDYLGDRFLEISLRIFYIIGFIYIGWEYFGAISDIAFTGTHFFFDVIVGKQMLNWNYIIGAMGHVCAFCIAGSILKMLLTITYSIRFRWIGYILSILYVSLLFSPIWGVFVSPFVSTVGPSFLSIKLFMGALFIIFMIANVIFVPILDWR